MKFQIPAQIQEFEVQVGVHHQVVGKYYRRRREKKRHNLLAIHGIRYRNGRNARHAKTCESESEDEDDRPGPLILIAQTANDNTNNRGHEERDQRRQSHLRLPDAVVPLRQNLGNIVGERTSSEQANDTTNDKRPVCVSQRAGAHVVRRRAEHG